MKHEITIDGRFPSYNEYTNIQRGDRYAGNRMKQKYQRICEWNIRRRMRKERFDGPISIHITCYEEKCNRDLDNVASFFFKVFQDAMVQCGTIKNDNIKHVTQISAAAALDKKHPRVEVVIEEQDE